MTSGLLAIAGVALVIAIITLVLVIILPGKTGSPGPPGEKGPMGPPSINGTTGATGPTGPTGADGPQGKLGNTGDPGLAGNFDSGIYMLNTVQSIDLSSSKFTNIAGGNEYIISQGDGIVTIPKMPTGSVSAIRNSTKASGAKEILQFKASTDYIFPTDVTITTFSTNTVMLTTTSNVSDANKIYMTFIL